MLADRRGSREASASPPCSGHSSGLVPTPALQMAQGSALAVASQGTSSRDHLSSESLEQRRDLVKITSG